MFKPFILVHGGTSTGAIWDRVVPFLKAAGHIVYTPDLKGMGSRISELSSDITLDDYIKDICDLITQYDLKNIILVGHSNAGLIITAVGSLMSDRINKLIYLDALLPEVGSTAFSLLKPEVAAWLQELANESGDGWRYLPEQVTSSKNFPDKNERDWVLARRSPQPINPQNTPVYFDPKKIVPIPKYYVYCTADGGNLTKTFSEKVKQDDHWHYDEINTGHMLMVTEPEHVARLLIAYAKD